MHKVRRHARRAALVEIDALDLDARQAANARTDRAAGALLLGLGHVGQASIFQRLTSGINAIDDEGIDLTLDLVIHALVRVEAPGVILALHLAGDGALLVRGIEPGDLARPALPRNQVGPCRFDIGSKRGDEAKPGNNHTAHSRSPIKGLACKKATGPTRLGLSLSKP